MDIALTVFGILAIVLLTAISGFFSSSELAVFSVARHRIDTLVASTRVSTSIFLRTVRPRPLQDSSIITSDGSAKTATG